MLYPGRQFVSFCGRGALYVPSHARLVDRLVRGVALYVPLPRRVLVGCLDLSRGQIKARNTYKDGFPRLAAISRVWRGSNVV